MKVLITSDVHIHPHRNDPRRIEDGLECLRWIYETAITKKCGYVIIAGDFMHHRFSLSVLAYAKACRVVSDYAENGVKTIFLLGNHDMYFEDRWDIHSLVPIKEWARVIDQPSIVPIGNHLVDFLPYHPFPSKLLSSQKWHGKVMIAHLALADALLNTKYDIKSVEDTSKDKETISVDWFKGWEKVWLGHFHYGQKIQNCEYIGSPMQLTFGEANQEKHVAIFDLETLETEYVVNTVSPRFYIIEDTKTIETLDVNNCYVQMRLKDTINSKFELRKRLGSLGAREIEFPPSQASISIDTKKALGDIVALMNSKNTIIKEFVKSSNVPPSMNKSKLEQIGLSIIAGRMK